MKLRSSVAVTVAGLAAVSVAGAACGSSSLDASSARAVVSTQARSHSPGSKVLVTLSDFPAGWKAQGQVSARDGTSSGLSGSLAGLLGSCLGAPKAAASDARSPHWNSPTFSDGTSAINVNDDVTVFSNARKAAHAYDAFANPKTPGCLVTMLGGSLKQQVSQHLQQGLTVGQVTSSNRPFPTFGQRSGDIELVVPIAATGRQVPIYLDVIVVLQGRTESTLTASSPNTPFPSNLGGQLAQAAAAHMQQISQ